MRITKSCEEPENFDAVWARRNGEPLPVLESSIDQNSPAREQFRQRLDEMGQRLRRYAELRDMYGIR